MVYCGPASKGCQNCRIRRIKCDKVNPECSQCIRVGKKCPGYRDQLSLMFRDESSKVMQKAHAQWGMSESQVVSPSLGGASYASSMASSPVPSSTSPLSPSSCRQSPQTPASPVLSDPSSFISSSSNTTSSAVAVQPSLCKPLGPNHEEQGVQFYINRYLIGHPDEPKTAGDLSSTQWLWSPALQDIMAAVGLAGLSNLKSDRNLMTVARQRYGKALRQTGQLIQASKTPDFEVAMRAVVTLAMFELVKGTHRGIESVHAHVIGAAALLRAWCPMPGAAFGGIRALIQLCCTMFIPAHIAGVSLPAQFHEWMAFGTSLLNPADAPVTVMGQLTAQFIQLSAIIQSQVLTDGRPRTTSILQKLIDVDDHFIAWAQGLSGIWCYRTQHADHLPRAAIFQGEYHIYYDMWVARMWAHYRWARILLNQSILEFINSHPMSSLALISAAERSRRFSIIQCLAKDTLISTPSHWRHPLLDDKSPVPVEKNGGAGSGAAGIPVVLFQIKVAACAPGVPSEYWDWALGVMECIWSDLGMLHAKSMMETMQAHRDGLCRAQADGILAAND